MRDITGYKRYETENRKTGEGAPIGQVERRLIQKKERRGTNNTMIVEQSHRNLFYTNLTAYIN